MTPPHDMTTTELHEHNQKQLAYMRAHGMQPTEGVFIQAQLHAIVAALDGDLQERIEHGVEQALREVFDEAVSQINRQKLLNGGEQLTIADAR